MHLRLTDQHCIPAGLVVERFCRKRGEGVGLDLGYARHCAVALALELAAVGF